MKNAKNNRRLKLYLSPGGIDKVIKGLEEYQKRIEVKGVEVCKQLAKSGAEYARKGYERDILFYPGQRDRMNDIKVYDDESLMGHSFWAEGRALLFLEFGAGVTYGYGHPLADELGFGPGTYPGKGHWDDPDGWWYFDGLHFAHTYGNRPSQVMYAAAKRARLAVPSVAKEVFARD